MRKLPGFTKKISISSKFVAAYSIIFIIQIILTGVYLYFKASNAAIDQAKFVMQQNLMQTKASILEKVKVIENISEMISYNEDIRNFMEIKYNNQTYQIEDYQLKFTPMMKNILAQNNIINSIKVYMPGSIVIHKLNSFSSIGSRGNPGLYEDTLKKKLLKNGWGSVHDSYDNNTKKTEQVFSFYNQTASAISFRYIGALEIEVKEKVLFDMLRIPAISKLGRILVVDNNNNIVSNNIAELFKKNISSSGITNFTVDKEISKVERVNNIQSIVISIPIEHIGYSMVGIFPVSNFNSKAKESVANIIVILLLLSLFLEIIIYLTTNVLLSRIKKLVKAMKQVRDGNLDVSVEVKTKDEFGELGLSFNHMTGRIHDLVETVYKIQIMEREAELKALESQINPHFLYNTLATISWAARKENTPDVIKITNSLAKFYRLVLSKGNTLISVKDEIEIVVLYLSIQKIRFQDTLEVIYEIDESIYNNKIVKNILQPVVENALIHGIETKRGRSTIIIKASEHEDRLYFKIIDDGLGMSMETQKEILSGNVEKTGGSGYAIKNIMQRLKAYYGDEQSFEIFSKPGFGTVIEITVAKFIEL